MCAGTISPATGNPISRCTAARTRQFIVTPKSITRTGRSNCAELDLSFGMFRQGRNLTTEGITEETVCVGDQFRVGSALLQVTQPRMPCFKLGIRFGRADMVKRFWQSGRPGIYVSVVEEGDVAAGDLIEKIAQGQEEISVADVVRLYRWR